LGRARAGGIVPVALQEGLMMDYCECCGSRRGTWHLLDENAEVVLCAPCVRELRKAGESVAKIPA
jgi:hypothetical protein